MRTVGAHPIPRGARSGYDVVLVAASVGGFQAVRALLGALPVGFPSSVVVLIHRTARRPQMLGALLRRSCALEVRDARAGEPLAPGTVYVTPPDLHVLIRAPGRIELSAGRRIRHVLSSANPLFESAARALGERVIAVVLTGSGHDATDGAQAVRDAGGVVIVQEPTSAAHRGMPESAVATGAATAVLPLERIGPAIVGLVAGHQRSI